MTNLTLQEAKKEYISYITLQNPKSDNTILSYENDLNGYIEYLEKKKIKSLDKITTKNVEDFIEELLKSISKRSVARKMTAVRNFHRYLEYEYEIHDPTEMVKVKINQDHLPDYLSLDEVNQIMNSFEDSPLGIYQHAMLELLYNSGLRVHECTGLKLNQLYLEQGIVRVLGKGGKERIVPFQKSCKELLERYITEVRPMYLDGKTSAFVFINPKGKPTSRQYIWKVIQNQCQKCGIQKHVSPHTFRHTFASELLENGADLRSVQELLGHSDIATTQIYTHVQAKRLHDDYDKYFPRGKKVRNEDEEV